MADATTAKGPVAKGEEQLKTKFFKQFKGCYTKADRSAMPDDYFYYLENLMPIGASNLRSVPGPSPTLFTVPDIIYWSYFCQVAGVNYQINFGESGAVYAYNWATGAKTTLASGLSGTGSRAAQFENEYLLVIDSTGYYSWDGTTWANNSVATGIATGTDISVYAGRVWVSSGRLLSYTAAYDGTMTTDPTTATAWSATYGSSFVNFTDPLLVGPITRLWAQNGYLFVFGSTCLYSISNVYIPTGASPPTPAMTILNVQGIIGTDQPGSVFPFNRDLMFANRFGTYASDGVNAQKFSEDIDGTFQYLSFNPSISGGQCVVNNILCSAFLFQREADPVFGSDTVIGLYWDQKWWFANFGPIQLIATAIIGEVPTLVAFVDTVIPGLTPKFGQAMFTIFTNDAVFPNGIAMTPLWDMGNPISLKEVIRAAARIVFLQNAGNLQLSVDGYGTSNVITNESQNVITFIGAGQITWSVAGTNTVQFTTPSTYELLQGPPPGGYSPGIGMTLATTGADVQIAMFGLAYKERTEWYQR